MSTFDSLRNQSRELRLPARYRRHVLIAILFLLALPITLMPIISLLSTQIPALYKLFLIEIQWAEGIYGRIGYYGICVTQGLVNRTCVPWSRGRSPRDIAFRLSLQNCVDCKGPDYLDRFGSDIVIAANILRKTFFPSLLISGWMAFALAFSLTQTSIFAQSLKPTVRMTVITAAKTSAYVAAFLFLLAASFSQAAVVAESTMLDGKKIAHHGNTVLTMQWVGALLAAIFAIIVSAEIEAVVKETYEGYLRLETEDADSTSEMSRPSGLCSKGNGTEQTTSSVLSHGMAE